MNRISPSSADNSAPRRPVREDGSADLRVFAAWLGLGIVLLGVVISTYIFWRVGEVLLDPRSFETQVDRWEFVVRGRTTDAIGIDYETADNKRITMGGDPTAATDSESRPKDKSEEMADMLGRIASKSSRPAALMIIIIVLSILVRIAIGVIHAGIRLTYLTAGEKDYMKRIIEELREDRNRP